MSRHINVVRRGAPCARDARRSFLAVPARVVALAVALAIAPGGAARAQQTVSSGAPAARIRPRAAQAAEGDFVVRDFHFDDGETLPELRLHYHTLGAPRRDAAGVVRNAVLIIHGTGGSGRQFLSPNFAGELFGPGQLLDTTTHFIVLPDNIGHSQSTKPSDGMHARFPHYGYGDMVRAQHLLLTDALHVNHLLLVMGTSMGGMQTWMWGEAYPDFMDGLVPLASLPTQIAGRNRMMRQMIADDIRDDPSWNGGDYAVQPRGLRGALQLLFMMTSSPRTLQRMYPTRDSAEHYIERWMDARMKSTDANDLLYAFQSSRDYNPEPALEKIRAPLLAINSADDQVNPPELGVMDALMPRVAHGHYVLLPITDQTRGHGTHSLPAIWKPYLAQFLAAIEAAPAVPTPSPRQSRRSASGAAPGSGSPRVPAMAPTH